MSEPIAIFTKVHSEDNTRLFRLKIEWEDGYFRIFVVEGTSSWFALVTRQHIETLAAQHELHPNVYLENIRKYLGNDSPTISFDIVKKQFFIYHRSEKENFRIKYFFVNLEKLNYQETIETFVDDLLKNYTEATNKAKQLEEAKFEIESEKLLYERKCEEFVELKRKSDLKMYSAFALALNEKKHRIRFLTELLEESQNGRTPKFNIVVPIAKKQSQLKVEPSTSSTSLSTRPKETISDTDSNDSDGYNTDDEKNAKMAKNDQAVASTSKDDFDFLDDDSPPPPSIPKRIKSDSSLVASTMKHMELKANSGSKVINGGKVEKMEVEHEANSDDSDFSFNTQELLDKM